MSDAKLIAIERLARACGQTLIADLVAEVVAEQSAEVREIRFLGRINGNELPARVDLP